ncbi:MAG: hypothetical protein KY475_23005, partial [Planctomycetes bacterium]|nr:hypothetical protein [Planctomycetota bacterium]
WRTPILLGGVAWAIVLLAMLPGYPRSPAWLVLLSLIYPAYYVVASFICHYNSRRMLAGASRESAKIEP